MKVLVTGSTGFVGTHLCEELTNQGHEVYALARNPKKFQEKQVKGKIVIGSLETTNHNDWVHSLPSDLDAVIHTAGLVHSFSKKQFFEVNGEATKRLIQDLAKKYDHLNFVLISSMAVAGPSVSSDLNEKLSPNPVSDYGRSKLDAEQALDQIAPSSWQKTAIRPPMVIGPGDPAVLDVFKMVKQRFVLVAGTRGKQNTYSFICVHDLIVSIVKAVTQKRSTGELEVFYASHPQAITFAELINEIATKMNSKKVIQLALPINLIKLVAWLMFVLNKVMGVEFRLTPDKVNELGPSRWVCDSAKSEEALGMNYEWCIEKTIGITLADYEKRGWL